MSLLTPPIKYFIVFSGVLKLKHRPQYLSTLSIEFDCDFLHLHNCYID